MNCDCITKANEALKDSNTYIETNTLLNMQTNKVRRVVFIPTKPIRARGPKAVRIPASFCPLCGVAALGESG